jgi:1-acyl-sn-glycerol-3-phosphate acyltransferase
MASMVAAALRRTLRLPLLVALLLGGLATVTLAFPFGREPFRRAAIRIWSGWLCRCCGLRVVERPAPGARPLSQLPPGRLVVANHISWLDIFAIDASCPAAFVAKAEIARWPLLGTLVARTGTLFIERGKRHAVHRMIEHIDRRLQVGGRVAVFPEGTTGDGRRLLPFHANLVQAALDAGVPVVPIGLRYVDADGSPSAAIEYVGDTTFLASLWRIVGAPGMRCELHALPEIAPCEGRSRHAIAQSARAAISERLALPLEDVLPEKLRDLRVAGH